MCVWAIMVLAVTGLISPRNCLAVVQGAGSSNVPNEAEVSMASSFVKLVSIRDASDPLKLIPICHFALRNVVPLNRIGDWLIREYSHSVQCVVLGDFIAISKQTTALVLDTKLSLRDNRADFRGVSVGENSDRQGGGHAKVLHDRFDFGVYPNNSIRLIRRWVVNCFSGIHPYPRPIASNQSVMRCYSRVFSGISRFSHLLQLAIVNKQSKNADNPKADLAPECGVLYPMRLFRKSLGIFLTVIGAGVASLSHWLILYERKYILGIAGWLVAAVFIWHGGSLLLSLSL